MADALDRPLDELIQAEPKKGKGKGGRGGKGNKGGKGKGSWGNSSWEQSWGGRKEGKSGDDDNKTKSSESKLDLTLDELATSSDKGKGKGKGKGKSRNWDSGSDFWGSDSWGSDSKGKGKGKSKSKSKSWSSGEESSGKGGGTPAWNKHDDWRGSVDNREDDFYTGGGGKGYSNPYNSGYGKGSSRGWGNSDEGPRRPAREEARGVKGMRSSLKSDAGEWQRVDQEPSPPPRRFAGRDRDRGREAREAPRSLRGAAMAERTSSRGVADNDRKRRNTETTTAESRCKRVKVTNIPRDLDEEDIKEAFEAETGKILNCETKRNTIYLTFQRAQDAKKSVETFDHGELNGKRITVALDV